MAHYEIPKDQVRALQLKSLEMALFFDAFCQKHNLTWYLCGGCCIGTARHKGFIPWDDDIDLFMPREDYERLKTLWVDTPRYSIQYATREKPTANQFLTINDNSTTFIKSLQKDLDINHGVVLDILPLDGCPQGFARKCQKLWALLYSLLIVGKPPTNHGRMIRWAGKVLLNLVRPNSWRYRAWRLCERKMTKYPISQCKYITELCAGPHYMQNEYPKEYFEKPIRVEFEGHMLPVPVGYDGYLTMAFGDYMRLPPPEKQVCHHEVEYMDLENSYLNYRGIYYCTGKE